jgi:hypothetical protein
MTKETDTQSLLRKLATIWCPMELTGFEFGLKRYRSTPPSAEVLQAVARKKAQLEDAEECVEHRI